MVAKAGGSFLQELDSVTVDDLCRQADSGNVFNDGKAVADFTI